MAKMPQVPLQCRKYAEIHFGKKFDSSEVHVGAAGLLDATHDQFKVGKG